MNHRWSVFDGDDGAWDTLMCELQQDCVFQSSSWGRHKLHSGWEVLKLVSDNQQSPIAIQVLIRRGPIGLTVAWAPGGFAGELKKIDRTFLSQLKHLSHSRFLYFRFGMMVELDTSISQQFCSTGFSSCAHPIGAKQSMLLSTSADEEHMLARTSSNWKRNYKRSFRIATTPYVWVNSSSTELAGAYKDMNEFKKIKNVTLSMSEVEIASLLNEFDQNLVLIRMDDEEQNLLSVRGALIYGSTAWDFIAVTTPLGRKSYSSHRTLVALSQEVSRRGCTTLELGGIDPENNKGVYDFKHGTGATTTTYLGEWEQSHPSWIRPAISRIVTSKTQ